jgi:hypothetical protein
MKAGMACVLLLSACSQLDTRYDYSLTWMCLSPEGCERTAEVQVLNRLTLFGDALWFESTRNKPYLETAQRVESDSLPEGCYWVYGFSLFGHELEPSELCRTSDGFELDVSIPNRNPATHSEWLVEAREL